MSQSCIQKLVRDLKNIKQEQEKQQDGIYLEPIPDDIQQWEALIEGPENSIWEGAIFRLLFDFSDNYPNSPPEVRFMSPIFHPNVYQNGNICLDILQNKWSTLFNAHTICVYIRLLLEQPNPDSPANPEAAKLFTQNYEEYQKKVKEVKQQTWVNTTKYEWDD